MRRAWLDGAIGLLGTLTVICGRHPWLVTAQSGFSSCSSVQKELVSGCEDYCSSGFCIGYDAAKECSDCVVDEEGECEYLCVSPTDRSILIFSISFGEYQSDEEIAARAVDSDYDKKVDEVMNETSSDIVFVSNDDISTIGVLEIDPSIRSVYDSALLVAKCCYFNAGRSGFYLKSKVVDVNFTSSMFSSEANVTTVRLQSINLKDAVDDLSSMLPSSLTSLDLDNCLLTEFPDLDALEALEELDLTGNYISSVNNDASQSSITTLSLADNGLSSFEGVFFNNLINLDLSDNLLTAVPETLANNHQLQLITLTRNAITTIDASLSWGSLTDLYLGYNGVTSFEAIFPSLERLYLDGHNMSEIPATVYNHTNLHSLSMSNGSRKLSPNVTPAQFEFLMNFTYFGATMDDFDSSTACEYTVQNLSTRDGPNLTFCVGNFLTTDSSADSDVATTSAPSTTHSDNTSSTGTIIASVIGVVVVMLIVAIAIWRKKRRSRSARHAQNTAMPLWKDDEMLQLALRPEDIQDIKQIGGGAWGVVWLVKYRGSQLCAAKRLRADHATRDITQAFADEIKLVAKFDHPHIVTLVGAAWTVATDLQALFEYMENGDLRDYLVDPSTSREWGPQKLQIATDIVDALVYVHSFDPPVVHRDLKSRNVLMSGEMRAKLTDFGCSRYKSLDETMTLGVGTARWLAPEVLSSQRYDQAADIFSFGVLLSELDTHVLPYEGVCSANGKQLSDVVILQKVAEGSLRPEFGEGCPAELRALADRCLSMVPSERPLAPEIAYGLRMLKRSLNW